MKKFLFLRRLSAIVLLSITGLNARVINDWENPDVNGINKERPRAYSFLAEDKANNPLIKSLNGIWKFRCSHDPQSRPNEFYSGNRPCHYGFILEYLGSNSE